MAVVSVTEHMTARSGGQNRLWQRTYSRAFLVITDAAGDDAKTVLLTVPVAIGQQYVTSAATDLGSYCQDLKVQCSSEDGKQWTATAEYGPYDATQKPQNPLDQQPDISWEGQPYQKPVDLDTDGNLILNSAGDPFDPPIVEDFVRPILRITRNERYYNPALATSLNGVVNSGTFCGADPRIVKLQMPPGQRVLDPDIGYFWVVTYEFLFNPDGWTHSELDQGMRQIDPADATKNIDITKSGVAISTPVPLNGAGAPLAVGDDPTFLEFKTNPEYDFSSFGFDDFLAAAMGL